MKNYLTLDSINISKKIVGIRVDINSPIINNKVKDNLRITQACKSIEELLKKDAKIIIFGHQGRKGKSDFTSLELHQEIIEEKLNTKIIFIKDISKNSVNKAIKEHPKQQLFLIENLRNLDIEQKPEILKSGNIKTNEITKIIEICNYYVLDAFSISHRAHSSVLGSSLVPLIAGRLLQKELKPLSILENTPHPRVYVMGGSKPDDLLPLIKQSLEQKSVDYILLSGVIGEIALHSQGHNLGKKWDWIVEHEFNSIEKELKQLIKKFNKQFILPKDVAYINNKHKRIEIPITKLTNNNKVISEYLIQDIGSKSVNEFIRIISKSKSCYIKGPQGNFELKGCEFGTFELFKKIAKDNTFSFMGGGHTVTAAQLSKTIDKFSYVSLAGGALVQFIEGKKLAGIETLEKSYEQFSSKTNHFDMVVVGSNVVDTFVNSPQDIDSKSIGKKIKVEENFKNRVGGGGIHVSSHISKLGGKVGLISRLSAENNNLISKCSEEYSFSILTSKIRTEESAKSILIQTPKEDRLIFTFRGQNQNLDSTDFPKELPISNYYFSGLTHKSFNTQSKIMKKIKKEQNSLITYNPSSYTISTHQEEILNNLKYIDILIFNDEEAELLTQEKGIKHNLHLLSTLGPKIVVITNGSKGAYAIENNSNTIYYQMALTSKNNVVDTTGAGDCFAATFFYFKSKHYSTQDCLKLSAINSANLVQKRGSLNGSLTLKEIKKEFYKLN